MNNNGLITPESDFNSLLLQARHGSASSMGRLLHQYRSYLAMLAATQFKRSLKPRVDPSDVVQDTLLRACKHFGQFRGRTQPELLAWLRQILVNSLAQFVEQHVLAQRRDVRREVSIDKIGASLEQSTVQLAQLLPAEGDSPSRAMHQHEAEVTLAHRLAMLPADYRQVLILRNLQELPFDEVANRLDRSVGAARMLWLRAMEALRSAYGEESMY